MQELVLVQVLVQVQVQELVQAEVCSWSSLPQGSATGTGEEAAHSPMMTASPPSKVWVMSCPEFPP